MSDKTNWEPRTRQEPLRPSGPRDRQKGTGNFTESNIFKAGLAVAAGVIIAALAKGVKDSDYYDR